ncbi:TetR/AcrR family transcriptional regulator [Paenibacillus sp. FA6]|uniref:TetR/AcrR family transcriptional regulator n=1 Tax=Paenibacillus sp. FA6 TaxID=3413029 RepID=UPI003F658394
MSEKQTDRKTYILKMALQLFSTQGISSTSMQEIAEVCEMSKGSLYLHFKSKEELEESIYLYCYQLVLDSVMLVEQDSLLSPREQLQKQVEVLLSHLIELREFLKKQFIDGPGPSKKHGHPDCIREDHFRMLGWFKLKLESIYGPKVEPYTMDLTLFFGGILASYLRMLFIPGLPLNIQRMSRHLISLLDDVSESFISKGAEPLIDSDMWSHWVNEFNEQSDFQRHPLQVTKEMKVILKENLLHNNTYKDALESIHILEKEIVDIQPRRVILLGMIGNLAQISELQVLNDELKEIISLYSNN